MRILGIDPGYDRLGIAILEKTLDGKTSVLFSECFTTDRKDEHFMRLRAICERVGHVIHEWAPELLAIEMLYFSKNQKTALQVAEARGALLAICASHGLSVREFQPAEIKIAMTGYGKADKRAVFDMVTRLIKLPHETTSDDEIDAIAVALTASITKILGS
jgi:crossover junction endodeoxyribonuclease RuvC